MPRSRDKIKLELKESDIPFYDPYLIVKKRRGEWQKEYNQMTIRRANEELAQMIKDDTKPIYVAADENDNCLGYAFARIETIYNHIHDEEVGIVPCVFNGIPDVQLVCLEKYRLI